MWTGRRSLGEIGASRNCREVKRTRPQLPVCPGQHLGPKVAPLFCSAPRVCWEPSHCGFLPLTEEQRRGATLPSDPWKVLGGWPGPSTLEGASPMHALTHSFIPLCARCPETGGLGVGTAVIQADEVPTPTMSRGGVGWKVLEQAPCPVPRVQSRQWTHCGWVGTPVCSAGPCPLPLRRV